MLVAEVAPRRAALAALADALAAGAKAAQQSIDLEAAYSCIAGETMRLERELAATGLWEKRAEVQARLHRSEECRKDSKKAVDAARKAGAAAASRGEKARKQLLRLGSGAGAPPIEDELNVLEAARALREAHALAAAREAEAADDVRARKEAAAAQVAAAMAALEQMSEDLHAAEQAAAAGGDVAVDAESDGTTTDGSDFIYESEESPAAKRPARPRTASAARSAAATRRWACRRQRRRRRRRGLCGA